MAGPGVTRSHNRPHTSSRCFGELARADETRSNDNPFSESHFRTLKYQPRFPKRFGRIEDAKVFCRRFFDWYNQDHHHCGIGLMTPDQVHHGHPTPFMPPARSPSIRRLVNKPPVPPTKQTATWINPPAPKKTA
jgi:putative transposase